MGILSVPSLEIICMHSPPAGSSLMVLGSNKRGLWWSYSLKAFILQHSNKIKVCILSTTVWHQSDLKSMSVSSPDRQIIQNFSISNATN